MAVTDDASANGKLLGIVTGRDYRVSRMSLDTKVSEFMTPFDKLICGHTGISLKEANDLIDPKKYVIRKSKVESDYKFFANVMITQASATIMMMYTIHPISSFNMLFICSVLLSAPALFPASPE